MFPTCISNYNLKSLHYFFVSDDMTSAVALPCHVINERVFTVVVSFYQCSLYRDMYRDFYIATCTMTSISRYVSQHEVVYCSGPTIHATVVMSNHLAC